MRGITWALGVLVGGLGLGCASSQPAEPQPIDAPGPSTSSTSTASATADATSTSTAATAEPTATATTTAVAKPPAEACPAGMALVEGEYCPEVEHNCTKEWYAEANKKRVCEVFEEGNVKCTGTKVKKRYCIDQYEWPNKKGERPEVMNRFHQAQMKCAAVGKRMCSESEWTLACEGPEMKPFPYGWRRDPLVCNGDHKWDNPNMDLVGARDPKELARLWRGMPSGSQPGCVSDFGVYDMPANADEVVATEQNPNGNRGKFDSIHTGGPWYSGVRNQCRPKVYTHGEDFYYYFLSFRCCAEPDGALSNPLTARQQKSGWSLSKVEQSAQFKLSEIKEKLALKAEGKCTCDAKDILCKTMCGTLLGPNAKDATKDTPRARYAGKKLKGKMQDE